MKRILIGCSAVLLLSLSACGNKEQQRMQMKSDMHISAIDTNLPANKYVAKGNESLADIADRYHVNLGELQRLNPSLTNGNGAVTNPNPVTSPNPNTNQNAGAGASAGSDTGRGNGQQTSSPEASNNPVGKGETVNLPANESLTDYEQQVLDLTNAERKKAGLSVCAGTDSNLNRSARAKSQDMSTNNYFSHTSPTYGDPFAMMRTFGVQYQSAGENIAMGQPTPEAVVEAWMNSPGHRENILKASYNYLGVGYVVKDGKAYWTQQFIGK